MKRIKGTNGDDDLDGTGIAELISGLRGNDSLNGMGGHDRLAGGKGDDDLYGGTGNDTFLFVRGDGHDTIHDWNIGDVIDLPGGKHTVTQVGSDVHITYSGGAQVDVIGVNIGDLTIV